MSCFEESISSGETPGYIFIIRNIYLSNSNIHKSMRGDKIFNQFGAEMRKIYCKETRVVMLPSQRHQPAQLGSGWRQNFKWVLKLFSILPSSAQLAGGWGCRLGWAEEGRHLLKCFQHLIRSYSEAFHYGHTYFCYSNIIYEYHLV